MSSSNWFQDHPARSIIGHTILVATVTWAIFAYLLEDRELRHAKAEINANKAILAQSQAQIETLTRDLAQSRQEVLEYKKVLEGLPEAGVLLGKELAKLRLQLKTQSQAIEPEEKISGLGDVKKKQSLPNTIVPNNLFPYYDVSLNVRKGSVSYIEELRLLLSVSAVYANSEAIIKVSSLGDNDGNIFEYVKAGFQWAYKDGQDVTVIIVEKVNFATDTVSFRLIVFNKDFEDFED